MLDLGTLTISIEVDDEKAKQELDKFDRGVKDTGKSASSVQSKFTRLGKIIKAAFAAKVVQVFTNKIISLAKEVVNAYAELEQFEGGIEALFGGYEKGSEQINKVLETSKNAWRDYNMSQSEYLEAFTSIYALVKSSTDDENEAIDETNRLIALSTDLANTYGGDVQKYLTAIQWALKDNYSYIDNTNLGIKGTKEGFLEAAHAAGFMVDSVDELSAADKIAILEYYADQYGVIGRTAEESANTVQGSIKMMQAAWQNWLVALADPDFDISEATDNLIEAVTTVFNNVKPVIVELVKTLVTDLKDYLSKKGREIYEKLFGEDGVDWESLGKSLGKKAGMIIAKFFDALVDSMEAEDGSNKVKKAFKKFFEGLFEGLAASLPEVAKSFINLIIKSIENAIMEALGLADASSEEIAEKSADRWVSAKDRIESNPIKPEIDDKDADISKSTTKAKNDWKSTRTELNKPANASAEVKHKGFKTACDNIKSWWQSVLDKANKTATFHQNIKSHGDGSGGTVKHRIGLREVPYDGYLATLHKGESILTAAEANQYNKAINRILKDEDLMYKKADSEATSNITENVNNYSFGNITLDVSQLEDLVTVDQFVAILKQAKAFV